MEAISVPPSLSKLPLYLIKNPDLTAPADLSISHFLSKFLLGSNP